MMAKLELEPEVQAGLLVEAQARGLSLEEYLKQVVRDHAAIVPPFRRKNGKRNSMHGLLVFPRAPLFRMRLFRGRACTRIVGNADSGGHEHPAANSAARPKAGRTAVNAIKAWPLWTGVQIRGLRHRPQIPQSARKRGDGCLPARGRAAPVLTWDWELRG
jgi:hypothetical protein